VTTRIAIVTGIRLAGTVGVGPRVLRAQQVDELVQWMVQDASLDRRGLKLTSKPLPLAR
jgi:hypothetical protein